MELSKEELQSIKKIANRIKNQDPEGKRWGTAAPLWFLLQDTVLSFDPINGGDFYFYYDSELEEEFKDTCESNLFDKVLAAHVKYNEGKLDEDEYHELERVFDINHHGAEYKYETKRIFHTYEAAESHLKANKHHYSDEARIYCDHAWRNPEAELIHKLLLTFAEDNLNNNPKTE